MTTKEDLLRFYQHNNKYFEAADKGHANNSLFPAHQQVLAYIKSLSRKRVCDFGCASGANIRAMYNDQNRYVGFDVSEDALRQARETLSPSNVEYVKLSGNYPLPAATGSFNIVTSFFTFEHLLEPATALDEFIRLLAPGGELFLIAPNYGSPLRSAPPLGSPSKPKTLCKTFYVLWVMLRRLLFPGAPLAITMIPLNKLNLSDTWDSDMDATCEPWSWEIAASLRNSGFRVSVITWEAEIKTGPERLLFPFRKRPFIKHLGGLCSIHAIHPV